MEIWKDVEGWDGLYQVSNLGRARALPRATPARNRWGDTVQRRSGRILRPSSSAFGHLTIGLNRGREHKRVLLHRLICEAFHGPCPPDKDHCAHWDGNPANNHADNLRWATARENSEDTRRHGNLRAGEASNLSKLTEQEVLAIRARAAAGESGYSISKDFGLTPNGARAIIRRKNWKHI